MILDKRMPSLKDKHLEQAEQEEKDSRKNKVERAKRVKKGRKIIIKKKK